MTSNMRGYNRRASCGQRTVRSRMDMYADATPRCDRETSPRFPGTKTGTGMHDHGSAEACRLREELMSLYFVMVELELYLDGHPNCTEALKRYRCTADEFKEATARYEAVFGPLYAKNNDCENEWRWVTTPWPWEV